MCAGLDSRTEVNTAERDAAYHRHVLYEHSLPQACAVRTQLTTGMCYVALAYYCDTGMCYLALAYYCDKGMCYVALAYYCVIQACAMYRLRTVECYRHGVRITYVLLCAILEAV